MSKASVGARWQVVEHTMEQIEEQDPRLDYDANETSLFPAPYKAAHDKASPTTYKYTTPFIRGVNLGGWFVLERFITPYQFALTDCHVRGDFCWYPGQVSAPPTNHPDYKSCLDVDLQDTCQPHRVPQPALEGKLDYPMDEYTLALAFGKTPADRERAAQWFNYHFENFITEQDIQQLANSGLTHVRVPLPHWILGEDYIRRGRGRGRGDNNAPQGELDEKGGNNTNSTTQQQHNDQLYYEPWITGKRWQVFQRLVTWCRRAGLQVWPDLHTAPGSQNGFDNSGQQIPGSPCQWSEDADHVQRSLQVLDALSKAFVSADMTDVVTGLGLLNEPFKTCNRSVYEAFLEQGRRIVRHNMGNRTAIFVSDMFLAKTFNNVRHKDWWRNPAEYDNTYLDSHYYQVFAEKPRALSPRQHIAMVCTQQYRDVVGCCYDRQNRHRRHDNDDHHHGMPWGAGAAAQPSRGIRRLVGEFSAAYDRLPVEVVNTVMNGIAADGIAPQLDRTLSPARQAFLRDFVEAQMVAFEAAEVGVSAGWFYWTLKMEGGAFAEWDYLRGLREGWMPHAPPANVSSQEVHGSCYDILFRTADDMDIIEEFPDPNHLPPGTYLGPDLNDDVIVSHGQSLLPTGPFGMGMKFLVVTGTLLLAVAVVRTWYERRRRHQYKELGNAAAAPPAEDLTLSI